MPLRDILQVAEECGVVGSRTRMQFDCGSVEYAYDVLVAFDEDIREVLDHTDNSFPVRTVDGHNGASDRLRRRCGTGRPKRRRYLCQKFDLVDLGNRHDHCLD